MNFKLRQPQGRLALARTASFSRAAAETSMTQPAFSQMIRELEATRGVRLFDRTTRSIDLTYAGRTLVGVVQVTLREAQNDVLLQKMRDREVDFGIGILAGRDVDLKATDLLSLRPSPPRRSSSP